jgi:mannose-6-phosphate isomerase-like protein (cupin superfamily)
MKLDLASVYVQLTADGRAHELQGGEAFWSRPPDELDALGRHWLATEFVCSDDWPQWEMHPKADELVYLLSGEVDFVLEAAEGTRSVRLVDRGGLVVPQGIWHTARVLRPSRLLFLTMGEGTQHRPA